VIILLILTFAGIIAIQTPGLIREKLWGELVSFFVLLAIAYILAILYILGIKITFLTL
jgi:hypothetical protein